MKTRAVLFFLGLVALAFSMEACSSAKDELDGLSQLIVQLEQKSIEAISKEEWTDLDAKVLNLENQIKEDSGSLSETELSQFEELKGRVAALKLKKNMLEWKDQIKDMTKQVEGFVDGIGK
jgi:hypothetical protein